MTLLISAGNLLTIFGLAFWIWKKHHSDLRPLFWPALAIKLAAGIALGLLYQNYYSTGDTFILFDQAKAQTQLLLDDPGAYWNFLTADTGGEWKGIVRSMFLVKIISLFNVFTLSSYWITSLWFSFISFLSSWYLVITVTRCFLKAKGSAAVAFLFFPSVVFWSSGIIKESLGLASLFILSGVYVKTMAGNRVKGRELALAALGLWVLWNLKYYWLAVFLPVSLASLLIHYASVRWVAFSRFKTVAWLVLFFALCLTFGFIHPNFSPNNFLRVVIENNTSFMTISNPANLIQYHDLSPSWVSILINSPWALISGLFRPFVWEADTLWKAVASLENLMVLVLFLSSLTHGKDFFQSQNRLLFLSVVVYVVLLCIFLALSTPNLGSLSRYKVGFLPFLIFLITYKNPLIDSGMQLLSKKLKNN